MFVGVHEPLPTASHLSKLAVSLELAEAIGLTISPPFLDDRAVQGFTSHL
jgi:hypothetical protein